MGTRADFYVGRGKDAEWLASIAWDGYPEGVPKSLLKAKDKATYLDELAKFLADREDVTLPDQGWPWPWEDSNTTDFSYAFDNDKVYFSCFGHGWLTRKKLKKFEKKRKAWEAYAEAHGEDEAAVVLGPYADDPWPEDVKNDYPNMKDKQNVAMDKRSGLMFISIGREK